MYIVPLGKNYKSSIFRVKGQIDAYIFIIYEKEYIIFKIIWINFQEKLLNSIPFWVTKTFL